MRKVNARLKKKKKNAASIHPVDGYTRMTSAWSAVIFTSEAQKKNIQTQTHHIYNEKICGATEIATFRINNRNQTRTHFGGIQNGGRVHLPATVLGYIPHEVFFTCTIAVPRIDLSGRGAHPNILSSLHSTRNHSGSWCSLQEPYPLLMYWNHCAKPLRINHTEIAGAHRGGRMNVFQETVSFNDLIKWII